MGVYILSVMTKEIVESTKVSLIQKRIQLIYPRNEINYSQYNYNDRNHKELDFDITEIYFNKDKIDEEISLLIKAIKEIFCILESDCEIIGGFNDTENAIMQYEKDKENNYMNWGLFATKNPISKSNVYYEKDGLYIYHSFKYDSMGVVF
ncbi:hypothetical protein EDD63_1344 [Breznakia blatticola]|uniref:Uncharacterized protein n=1 Tax=Breznakia blatticola TaxID=1754012 RepID=A0A4V6Q896_9FIRM|nr:hypothetical protein [Breznakia blatticola]TDW14694.1 hypothetical protein EDD63_1344 [Breznakia blatticola]